jgi:exocyst complex protein 7
MLSRANANLAATLVMIKDAREKFDTVQDVEPAIERLHKIVAEMDEPQKDNSTRVPSRRNLSNRVALTEQDVYAAADSMELLRDTYEYFCLHPSWKSSPSTLAGLERVHQMGLDAMCRLVFLHLRQAGSAVRPQRTTRGVLSSQETASETRRRLTAALQHRDLLKSIGEFEEYQPVEKRQLREMQVIFECLASHGYSVQRASHKREPPGLSQVLGLSAQKIIRTEKVGSGCYSAVTKHNLQTGFPQLDHYARARQQMGYASLDNYYRRLKAERKKKTGEQDEADAAARDAVRCLEHAMILVAGEKHIYRVLVLPSMRRKDDDYDDEEEETLSPFYKKGCAGAYAYIVGAVVDRALDIIEIVFLKEGGIGQMSGSSKSGASLATTVGVLTVELAASAAAAGLRMLDGVRMLGPSLSKLCEVRVNDGETEANSSLSAILCIAIHRTTVKNSAKTLENLAKAIQEDPLKGPLHRPKDASVSTVSSDVVRAIRLISPYVSAYKSISKRRALPWDPNMGEEAGELDSYVRYLVMRLLNSLKGKALNYTRDGRDDSQAKSSLFLINNSFYLLEELGPGSSDQENKNDSEHYTIEGSWFIDKVNKIMESEKSKYLGHWEALNTHLTAVGTTDIEYQKNDENVLSLESGRLIKQRFSGFNEDFERTFALHKKLCVIDNRLRLQLQGDVASLFLPRYRKFYDKYTKLRFSKKHQEEYTKYSPDTIAKMLGELYTSPEPASR